MGKNWRKKSFGESTTGFVNMIRVRIGWRDVRPNCVLIGVCIGGIDTHYLTPYSSRVMMKLKVANADLPFLHLMLMHIPSIIALRKNPCFPSNDDDSTCN